MNNQQNMMSNGYPMPAQNQGSLLEVPQQNRMLYIGYIVCAVLIAVGCFLPFVTLKANDFSMNYISYEGNIKDGVFVIALAIAATFCLIKRKTLVSGILHGVGIVFFTIDAFDLIDRIKEGNQYTAILGESYKMKLGIGFYLVLVALVLGAGLIILLLVKSKNKEQTAIPVPVPNQPIQPMASPVQPQAPVQEYCPYCRSQKKPGATFCNNCGSKF